MNRIDLQPCRALARRLFLIGAAFVAFFAGSAIYAQTGPQLWQASSIALGSLIASLPPSIVGIIMPEVVAWPDGTYRMYFGAGRGDGGVDIWYADSPDATTFTVRGLVLAGSSDPCDPEFTVTGASLVHLADGRWRMYYQARQSMSIAAACAAIHFQIYSAISSDGVTFTREGVRIPVFSANPSALLTDASHGRVLQLGSGLYVAIVGGGLAPPTPNEEEGLVLLTSGDGLTFGSPQFLPAAIGSHDPYWTKLGGAYVLYASPPDTSSVAVLTSPDGLNWSASSTANFEDGSGSMLSAGDIGGVVLGDGTLRLYSDYGNNFLSYRRIDGEPPIAPTNYEGLWWKAPAGSESGWGINFAHQGNVIFATWFTYNFAGSAWWLSMTANEVADNFYSGSLYQTNGPAFNAVPFDPAQVTATQIGLGSLYFSDANNGTFTYMTGGITQTKAITREVFGPLPACATAAASLSAATNYQDLWWAAPAGAESGWGVNLTQQGTTIFATWFTYDGNHNPLWYSVTATPTTSNTFSGTLYRTTGPAFDAVPFDPIMVHLLPVGMATFSFTDGNNGTFAYQVNDPNAALVATQTKAITRQVFRLPGTVCH